MKKIDLGVVVTTLIIVTISCSLAFFAARIVGKPKDINLVAKNVAITFTDTSSIADETISPGWNNVKSFTITNNSKEDFNYNILLKGLVNTFESINTLQYKITSDTGYNMDNYLNIVKTENSKDVVLAYDIVIPKGSKQTYQVEFKYISIDEDQSSDMGKRLSGTLAIEESTGKPKIYDKLLSDNPTIKTRTDFTSVYTETNTGKIFKSTETNTPVYYFAGNTQNNWVKFGTWQENKTIILGKTSDKKAYKLFSSISLCNADSTYNTDCKEITLGKKGDPMYWRIIRTNSDGSVRMLYAGTSVTGTDQALIDFSVFNESNGVEDTKYNGYMYGTSGSQANNRINENSSDIKKVIDNWYKVNLINYTKYLSTTGVYCNDRSIVSNSGADRTHFAGNLRVSGRSVDGNWTENQKVNPSYDCNTDIEGKKLSDASVSDLFSVSNISGNGKLTYPIALMTADEVVYAGGFPYNGANAYYVMNGENKSILNKIRWWLMTPGSTYINSTLFDVINLVEEDNCLNNDNESDYLYGVRPVISIKENAIYKSGDGSPSNPYEIVTE